MTEDYDRRRVVPMREPFGRVLPMYQPVSRRFEWDLAVLLGALVGGLIYYLWTLVETERARELLWRAWWPF